jgi:hypothetical protein
MACSFTMTDRWEWIIDRNEVGRLLGQRRRHVEQTRFMGGTVDGRGSSR